MESERKMKLSNLTKGVMAASAIALASFSANASIITSSILNVTNFGIAISDAAATTPSQTWSLTNNATFNGVNGTSTQVLSLDAFGVANPLQACAGVDCPSIAEDDYAQDLLDSTGTLNFSSSDSYIMFNPATGTNASSRADVSLSGIANNNINDAGSFIDNSITTEISFNVGTGGTLDLFYGFTAQLITEIGVDMQNPTSTTQAKASYSLGYTLTGNDGQAISFDNQIALFTAGVNASKASTQLNVNNSEDYSGSKSAQLTDLVAGEYTLSIAHVTKSSVAHVSEPVTLAILGLGLLGFAGAAKRRKS
jgi:hypothetical protein